MWGDDYPHSEGTYPYTTAALQVAFAGCPEPEVRAMVETNAADFYGFDLTKLRPIGDRIGPTVGQVHQELPRHRWPKDSTCNAFDTTQVIRSW